MKNISRILILALALMLLLPACALAKKVPYTTFLEASDEIYSGPGEYYDYEKTVDKDNIYIIIQEKRDRYGNLWGKLKSGAGWVMLEGYAAFEPYTVYLLKTDGIFEGPGYDYDCVDTVGKDNRYTIVEEAYCDDGYLWGRLKSGAGWVLLPDIVSEEPYTTFLGAWVPIFEGPGYDYRYKQLVGKDNTYTIVMERLDEDSTLWGKLKSGAGWIDLDWIDRVQTEPVIISFADDRLVSSDEYREYIDDTSRYAEKIAFRANEELTDVHLYSLGYNRYGNYTQDEELYSFRRLREDWPFVAGLSFYGDMTAYGLSFTDASGMEHHYAFYISGRNGSLVAEEYWP